MTRLWRRIKTAEWHALPNSGATNPPEHACTNVKVICNEKWYPPLFDQMIQCIWWTVALQSVCKMFITLCPSLLYLPFIGFKLSTKTGAIHTHTHKHKHHRSILLTQDILEREWYSTSTSWHWTWNPSTNSHHKCWYRKASACHPTKPETQNIEKGFSKKISSWSNEQSRFIGAKLKSAWWKQKGLKRSIPALLQQRLMSQKVYVFNMVISFIVSLKLLLWLSGVYALQNAQPSATTIPSKHKQIPASILNRNY